MKHWILGLILSAVVVLVLAFIRSRQTFHEETASGDKVAVSPKVRRFVPGHFQEALLEASQMELISLDPFPEEHDPEYWKERGFADGAQLGTWAVLGTILLDGPEYARAMNALYRGVDRGQGRRGSLFRPRHAIRIRSRHSILEAVLSYEVGVVQWRRDGHMFFTGVTGPSPAATLDGILAGAGVPLSER